MGIFSRSEGSTEVAMATAALEREDDGSVAMCGMLNGGEFLVRWQVAACRNGFEAGGDFLNREFFVAVSHGGFELLACMERSSGRELRQKLNCTLIRFTLVNL